MKEQVSDFTQLPEPVNGAHPHFILAPGEQLRLPIEYNKEDKLINGTSFAAPTSSGAYLLLKQHAIEKRYPATPEHILNIMEESGRHLTYKSSIFSATKIFKTLDVHAARILLDHKFREKPRVTYKSKPPITISQPSIQKISVVKKPVPKTPEVKKSTAKTSVLKKSPVKSKVNKKSSRKLQKNP